MEKRKKFLKLPGLDGGREALKKFIDENLVYPPQALENNVEGDVVIKYKVSALGEVFDAVVAHGIGHGCDEEALRLVNLLKYIAVKNRGIIVTGNSRIKIPFRIKRKSKLPALNIVFKPAQKKQEKTDKESPAVKKPETYSYTIKF